MKPIAVITTIGNRADAKHLATAIVKRKLAACAQLERIESCYIWKAKMTHAPEVRITFKTTTACYAALERAIRKLHPYELPAIHALKIKFISAAYKKWIAENTVPS
ncbi:MAG: divalent-cation tolerance protein CutA [Planctomycetota bacterium]